MPLLHQVITWSSHTTWWQIVELQDDNKLLEQHVSSLLSSIFNLVASCQQAVEKLSTSWKQAVGTHPVDKLLEQYSCYKSAAGLLQLVRFYVCTVLQTHLVDMLLEHHCHNLLTSLLQACWRVILLRSCWNNNYILQTHVVDKLLEQHCHKLLTTFLQTCCEKSCWQVVRTALSQLVNNLSTNLLRKILLTSC
jgi:hypothetical protein